MPDQLQDLYMEYQRLLDSQVFNPAELDYTLLDYHIPLLECIDVVDSGCISIFDLYQRKHVYYSPKFYSLLGWDAKRAEADVNYTNSLVHPDDLPPLFKAGIYYITLGFELPDRTKSREYKTIFEYRVKGKKGAWVSIIEQQIPLEFDRSGNVPMC